MQNLKAFALDAAAVLVGLSIFGLISGLVHHAGAKMHGKAPSGEEANNG